MKRSVLFVCLLLAALTSSFGQSVILFDELNAPNSGSDSVTLFGPLGESFSTGSSAVSLTDVMLKFNVAPSNEGPAAFIKHRAGNGSALLRPAASSAGAVTIALYNSNGLKPGTVVAQLGTVLDSSLPAGGAYQNFDIPVNPPVALTPNSMYWIIVTSSNNSIAGFAWTADVSGIGSANQYTFFQSGVDPNVGPPNKGQVDGPYQIRVTAAAPTTPAPTVTNVFDQAAATSNLTPGMPIQVVGTGFGTSSTDSATVMIGAEAAPVLTFINSTNLIVQVPVDAPLGPTTLTVTYKSQPSTAFNIKLVALAPEIEGFQSENGSAFYDASKNPITAVNPTLPGSPVYLLAIGLGTTNPAQVTDTIAMAQAPTTQQVQVMVGTKMVQPSYAGLFVGGTPGFYQVSFTVPVDAAIGNQPVTISVGGFTSNSQTLVIAAPAPPVPSINAIVNGATFKAGKNPQAANSFVSIFGQNFGSANTNGNIFPAMSFQGLSVLVNGAAIPLYVVAGAGGQINVVLPSELGTSGSASVEVMTAEGTSTPFQLALTGDSVGIFRVGDPSDPTRMNGAVLFTNTAWKVMPLSMATALGLPSCSSVTTASICGKPAQVGDQIEIYLTGLGKATPNGDPNGKVLATGSLAPTDGSVLYKTVGTPVVKIGGVPAMVEFSGIAPGNAGQYQINVQVPSGVKPDDNVTLQVTMPDGSTDTVTIAITS
jgi:uncharacterized protein (TIGR03437 family)